MDAGGDFSQEQVVALIDVDDPVFAERVAGAATDVGKGPIETEGVQVFRLTEIG